MNNTEIKKFKKLTVKIFSTEEKMALEAGFEIEREISTCIQEKGRCRIIFASAASQLLTLQYLRNSKAIEWEKVEAFHMDEYYTLPLNAPQRFAKFLEDHLFKELPLFRFHKLSANLDLPIREQINDYQAKLEEALIDICVMGIGENTHIAFNDPGTAKFEDPEAIKIVALDDICRQQQVNDGAFEKFSDVPKTAVTLTIPTLINAKRIFCLVPGIRKRAAVSKTLFEEVSENFPSTILQNCEHATLYIDENANPIDKECKR